MSDFPFVLMPQVSRPERPATSRFEQAPARVHVALNFLGQLTAKTQEVEVPHPMGSATQAAQELTVREQEAQTAALRLLVDYFAGSMKESAWDQEKKPHGLKMDCPQCNGHGAVMEETKRALMKCPFCSGDRQVYVVRASEFERG